MCACACGDRAGDRMSLPGIHGVTMSFNHLRVPRDCALASPALADAHHAHGHGSGKRTQFLAVSCCHACGVVEGR
jgi:hypothetical protein